MAKPASVWRDLRIISKSVWINLAAFVALLIIGASLMRISGAYPGAPFSELLVDAFHMAYLERVVEPGDGILPVILTFTLPVFSVVILGEGVLRVLSVYLRRGEDREEWDLMVAKTFSDHTVICGIGELGRAVYEELVPNNEDSQVVLLDTRPGILAELGSMGSNVVHVQADMTTVAGLEAANCQKACVVVLASGNDAYNLEAGLKAYQMNPNAEIWIRLYRIGLAAMLDLRTKPNVHFFSPYERAAEALFSHIQDSIHLSEDHDSSTAAQTS
jgi:hypothetical protein